MSSKCIFVTSVIIILIYIVFVNFIKTMKLEELRKNKIIKRDGYRFRVASIFRVIKNDIFRKVKFSRLAFYQYIGFIIVLNNV